jgi:dihydroneopterin triphosphate diphosphatase
MRAPFQILAIPYRIIDGTLMFCVMHRSDADWWQFIAGGGEDSETPIEAAKREMFEEAGVTVKNILQLTFMAYVPTDCFAEHHRKNWPADTYIIPEYCFAFECDSNIALSHEHTECAWLTYDEACKTLKWDSNRTALYELKCRLENKT